MIVEFSVYDTNSYTIEHLLDSKENAELIEQFEVGKNIKGLENYLKYVSSDDEENNFSRTYLVKDKTTKEIASYFSIRTGLITMQVQDVHQNKSSSLNRSIYLSVIVRIPAPACRRILFASVILARLFPSQKN